MRASSSALKRATPLPRLPVSFTQKCVYSLQSSTVHVLPPQPTSLLLQKRLPPLHLSDVTTLLPLFAVSLQGRGRPPSPPSYVRTYAPLLSALLPQRFNIHLQPSNRPAPWPHNSGLPLQHLALNPPPPPSVLIQGRGVPLLLPSVVYAHSPLIPALRL